VKNAATRKYLTADHLWYYPPPETLVKLVDFANEKGEKQGRPYFSINSKNPVTAEEWQQLRAKWNHKHGLTNVWQHPALRGQERLKDENGNIIHTNQKPLLLMENIITACTDKGDVLWEPFGGLCTASRVARELGRISYAAEKQEAVYKAALERLKTFKSV
jgi:DNA modification methylase